jgi:hypothetical protein
MPLLVLQCKRANRNVRQQEILKYSAESLSNITLTRGFVLDKI